MAEGVKLGAFLAKFHLSESTLANLLNLDNKLKPAWLNIMVSGTIDNLNIHLMLEIFSGTF